DIVYETDAWGHFTFLMPDPVLGWSAAALVDQSAALLLVGDVGAPAFNPFRVTAPVRRRRGWLRRVDGTPAMLAFSAAPLLDSEGRIMGTRGMGVDWSEFDSAAERNAVALRRGEVLDHILWRMGQEVLAPRMMQAALDALINALGAEGAGVIDVCGDGNGRLMHRAGGGADEVVAEATMLLASASGAVAANGRNGRPILAAVCRTRFGANAGLVLWRSPGSREWDSDDRQLVEASASLVRMVLEHEAIQHEMALQARTDPLTGLLNRRAFLDEMGRHIDRLDREELPGTLLFADLDCFKPVNDRLGHEVGDQVLVRTAFILRNTVRPSDLVARLGGDEFALWMDGADHMTSAERADRLCAEVPEALREIACDGCPVPTVSIGIATREAGSGEPVDSLLRRADQAMYGVKRTGRGRWSVAGEEPR
ncbi:MAG TPA: GGDEF domain-containing protein, partial [Acetobacteraceae bacterium]|nr:GGDEF domain-containing protein [Acetobacteraceae bacterium]